MSRKLAVIMDPIQTINPKKDSTLAMLLAAARRGWQLLYMEQDDLALEQGVARGRTRQLQVRDSLDDWFELGAPLWMDLGGIDTILMRKDPPVDTRFLQTTFILDAAASAGALVVNSPAGLRNCNEKVFATEFPQCCPPVLITSRAEQILQFRAEHGDIILKPLDGMGGMSVFRVKSDDPNINVIIETLTDNGGIAIMAQRYIPDIVNGDKRILLINGQAVPFALARVPAVGETRGNLAAGGNGIAQPLTTRDQWICEQVAPTLIANDLLFVGIDVIGDYLTEINVTSPTCIRELDSQCGLDIGGQLMDAIDAQLQANSAK